MSSADSPNIAFLFPGQGAQSVGMGATVCAQVSAGPRALFDRAEPVLAYDFYQLCTAGPAAKLDSTEHSQPAIFVASLAALEQLKRDSPEVVENCAAAAGLSLGEYTALVFAGVMDFDAGLAIVARAWPRNAGRGRCHVERHGQHPGPRTREGRSGLRRVPAAAKHSKSPICSAPATSSFPATRRRAAK